MTRLILISVVAVLLVGCASGAAPVAGQNHPAIEDYSVVSVLSSMPEEAEQIAKIQASSAAGKNKEQRFSYAVEDLKRRAAALGANAIVLTNRGTTSQAIFLPSSGNGPGQMTGNEERERVEGIAIYVR